MREFCFPTFGEGRSSHLVLQERVDLLRWVLIFQLVASSFAQSEAPGHLGCFVDSGDRALNGGSTASKFLSVQWCFKYCQDDLLVEFKYAGLEYQEECFCGNNDNYGKHGEEKESDCRRYVCAGNSDQFCGGSWRIAIYKISLGACSNHIGPPARGTNLITNPPGLSYNLNKYKFLGTIVNFFCDAGNVLEGSPAIECIQNGNTVSWNDSVPTCIALIPSTIPTTMYTTTTSAPTTHRITTTSTSRATTKAPPSSTEAASRKAQQTFSLDKASLIGIVIGALAALVIGLVIIFFICRKRGSTRKASPAVAKDTMGMSFSNNMYEITTQPTQRDGDVAPEPNQDQTAPIYSDVIRKQSRTDEGDVYAEADLTADYVNTVIRQSSGAHENGRGGLVENDLYENSSFRDESEMAGRDSNGQHEPFTTVKENPGWVENIIYE